MTAKGINIAEQCHVVNILPPLDIDAAAQSTKVFSMENFAHASIIIQMGVTGAASTVTVEECDDFTPTTDTPIVFNYYAETTDAGDTLGARTAATVAGFATSVNNNIMYVIEIDASELTDGYPCIQIEFTDPGAATFASAVAILSGARYSGDATGLTAIA